MNISISASFVGNHKSGGVSKLFGYSVVHFLVSPGWGGVTCFVSYFSDETITVITLFCKRDV